MRCVSRSQSSCSNITYFDADRYSSKDLPDDVDWRRMGIVTNVKNQVGYKYSYVNFCCLIQELGQCAATWIIFCYALSDVFKHYRGQKNDSFHDPFKWHLTVFPVQMNLELCAHYNVCSCSLQLCTKSSCPFNLFSGIKQVCFNEKNGCASDMLMSLDS